MERKLYQPKKNCSKNEFLARKKTEERTTKYANRLGDLITARSRKGYDINNKTYKYVIKGRNGSLINYKKYRLDSEDPIIKELKDQCKRPPTIGILALTELERMCGAIPQGGEIEKKLLAGFEIAPATMIWANRKYTNKPLKNYYQADITSAYAYMLKMKKMPTEYIGAKEGVCIEDDERICVYEDKHGNTTFNWCGEIGMSEIIKTHFFKAEYYGEKFVDKWFAIRQNIKYKKLAKDILVCSIGAIHKYRKSLIARYIWYLQKERMLRTKDVIETFRGTVVKIHTDSIGWLGEIPKGALTILKGVLGAFHEEHNNAEAFILSAGQYHIKGYKPTIGGISWNGKYIEEKNGSTIDWTTYPCIRKGMVVKSYEKDGIEWKELGKEILFVKGSK